jgi:hypothetical protein
MKRKPYKQYSREFKLEAAPISYKANARGQAYTL